MITDHRQRLFETRFAGEIDWQPARPSILPRLFHFIASAAAIFLAGAVLIGWITHG